jgi:hypothetical protein
MVEMHTTLPEGSMLYRCQNPNPSHQTRASGASRFCDFAAQKQNSQSVVSQK